MKRRTVLTVAVILLVAGISIIIPAHTALTESSGTSDNNSQQNMQDVLNSLHTSLKRSLDKSLSLDEWKENHDSITNNLELLLRFRASTLLSDTDLERALPGVRVKTKEVTINKVATKVRTVRWDGFLRGPVGTLERFWTYLQWWDDNSLHVQVLSKRGGDTPIDFLVLRAVERPTLILACYSRVYNPFPFGFSTWQLEGHSWVKAAMFGPSVIADDMWNIRIYGNNAIIESKPQKQLEVAPNETEDGFVYYLQEDKSKSVEIRVIDGQAVKAATHR